MAEPTFNEERAKLQTAATLTTLWNEGRTMTSEAIATRAVELFSSLADRRLPFPVFWALEELRIDRFVKRKYRELEPDPQKPRIMRVEVTYELIDS